MVTNDLGEVLAQNALAVALIGDETRSAPGGADRSRFHRWFTEPARRALHAPEEHERLSRSYVFGAGDRDRAAPGGSAGPGAGVAPAARLSGVREPLGRARSLRASGHRAQDVPALRSAA
jgi:hypothetical protein